MFLSGENCGLPRPHGLQYILVYNFSTLKPIAINLLFLHSYVTGSLYLYMQVRIYGLRHSLWVKNMVFSNKVKENSLLKFLKF